MARFSLNKGAATGASWAPIGFKLAGPKGAGIAFAAGTALGGFSGVDDQLDTSGYLKGLQRYEKKTLSQTRRAANEMGSRTGSNLAARGINDSKMGEYINQSNRGKMYGQTLDHLADTRAQMEVQLAHAQQMLKRARTTDERDAWARTTKHLYDWMMHEYLGDVQKGWESPEGAPVTPDDLPMTSIVQQPGMPERERPGSTMPEAMRPVTPEVADTDLPQIPARGVPTPEIAPAAPAATDMSPLMLPEEMGGTGDTSPIPTPKQSMKTDESQESLAFIESPQEQQIQERLGPEVASYLKQMLPNYAEIFEWT